MAQLGGRLSPCPRWPEADVEVRTLDVAGNILKEGEQECSRQGSLTSWQPDPFSTRLTALWGFRAIRRAPRKDYTWSWVSWRKHDCMGKAPGYDSRDLKSPLGQDHVGRFLAKSHSSSVAQSCLCSLPGWELFGAGTLKSLDGD